MTVGAPYVGHRMLFIFAPYKYFTHSCNPIVRRVAVGVRDPHRCWSAMSALVILSWWVGAVLALANGDVIRCEGYGARTKHVHRGGSQRPSNRVSLGVIHSRPVRLAWWCTSRPILLW